MTQAANLISTARTILLFVILLTTGPAFSARAQDIVSGDAARALIQRVIPKQAAHFTIEIIPADNGHDVFEVESAADKIVLRGNNTVSVASALNWYLKNECRCDISWHGGDQMNLPGPWPGGQPRPVSLRLQFLHLRLYHGVVALAGMAA